MLKKLLPVLCCLLPFSAVKAQRSKAVTFYKAGMNYKQNNNFTEALNSFAKAVLSDTKFDSAYVEMGNLFSSGGKIDNGIYNYHKALEINPNYTAALFGMGKIYRDAKPNYDSAIFCFKAAAAVDSTNKEFFYSIAWCYNAKAEYENAIPPAIKALEIDNTYRPAYGELGHAYRRTKKFAEAIEQFKKNLSVSVVDLAYFYSGMCYTELKDKEGAMKQYEELKKINERMASSLLKTIEKMQ